MERQDFSARIEGVPVQTREKIEEGHRLGFLNASHLDNRPLLEKILSRLPVAAHEIGHAKVIRALGGIVESISVIPYGNTLGVTKGKLGSIKQQIAACFGGWFGEQKMGYSDHSGTGHDMGQAEAFDYYIGGGNLSGQRALAGDIVSGADPVDFKHQAWSLALNGYA